MAVHRVLLIDDGEADNFIHEKIIEHAQFAQEVISTNSAEEGLAYLNNHPNQLPEIIFLDINMPVMDGFQFLQEYHNLPFTIREKCSIIVLSSSMDKDEINNITASPYVTDFFSKPLNVNMLEEVQLIMRPGH